MTLLLQDKMNRQLSCLIDNQVDSPVKLAEELVQHGFIHPLDSGAIQVHSLSEVLMI